MKYIIIFPIISVSKFKNQTNAQYSNSLFSHPLSSSHIHPKHCLCVGWRCRTLVTDTRSISTVIESLLQRTLCREEVCLSSLFSASLAFENWFHRFFMYLLFLASMYVDIDPTDWKYTSFFVVAGVVTLVLPILDQFLGRKAAAGGLFVGSSYFTYCAYVLLSDSSWRDFSVCHLCLTSPRTLMFYFLLLLRPCWKCCSSSLCYSGEETSNVG